MILLNQRTLRKIQQYCEGNTIKFKKNYYGLNYCSDTAEFGHLSLLILLKLDNFTNKTIDRTARSGHLSTVKWLHYHGNEASTYAIDSAAMNGHLDVVKWLLLNRNEGMCIDALLYAISFGHLNTVKFLYDIFTDNKHKLHTKIADNLRKYYYEFAKSDSLLDHATEYYHKHIYDWLKEQQLILKNKNYQFN